MSRHRQNKLALAVSTIRSGMPALQQTKSVVGVVLGSGLGRAADQLVSRGSSALEYREIPGMPVSGVSGHSGRMLCGTRRSTAIIVLQGRVHGYEGYSLSDVTFSANLLAELGAELLVVTNAAGGIRADFCPGDLMVIDGHIEFPQSHWQVAGNSQQSSGTKVSGVFTGDNPWDAAAGGIALRTATPLAVHSGTYALMPGPNYETPAEIRMLRSLGADAVGMSTVPEARCAAARGIRVLGVSCITNLAAGLSEQHLDHADVSHTAQGIETELSAWLSNVIDQLIQPECAADSSNGSNRQSR